MCSWHTPTHYSFINKRIIFQAIYTYRQIPRLNICILLYFKISLSIYIYIKLQASLWHLLSKAHLKLLQKPITTTISAAWFDLRWEKAINKHSFSRTHGVCHTWLGPGEDKNKYTDSLQYWNTLCQRSPPGKGSAWMLVSLLLQTASSGQRTARGCLRKLEKGQKKENMNDKNVNYVKKKK